MKGRGKNLLKGRISLDLAFPESAVAPVLTSQIRKYLDWWDIRKTIQKGLNLSSREYN